MQPLRMERVPFRMKFGASRLSQLLFPFLLTVPLLASGPYGADNGWAISNSGSPLLTPEIAQSMVNAGTGWIRIEMRLIPGHTTWDPQILGYYDTAVNNARGAGLQVLLLVDGGSWPGNQSAWESNSAEASGGNGQNDYVTQFAQQAVRTIVAHFQDRVKYYEIWNEPNAWTKSYGVGGTFLYPSNFAWMMANSWEAAHVDLRAPVVLLSGGVFGHNIGGPYSYDKAGAQYLDDTYQAGIQYGPFTEMKNRYGTYPLDGIGQHIYINSGGLVPADDFRLYEDYLRQAYVKYEGQNTPKRTFITEFGWNTKAVTQQVQDENLVTAFQTIDETPYIEMAIWFQWQDNPAGGLFYGVLDPSGAPKAAFPDYEKYETFQGRFPDRTVNQPIASYFASAGPVQMGNPQDLGNGAFVYTAAQGYAQDFTGGQRDTLTVYSGAPGTFEVLAEHGVRCLYGKRGGPNALGLPVNEEHLFLGVLYRQDFQKGSVIVPVFAAPAIRKVCEVN